MKAYKASYNGKCINITYEVGKTYTFDGELIICEQGFHFCKKLKDVFAYYTGSNITIFEIDVLRKVITEDDKSVTNKFKVIRILDPKEYQEYYKTDDKGNVIYRDGNTYTYTYDDNKNLFSEEDSNGFWKKYTYDDKNNKIYEVNCVGFWKKYTYDDKNNLIYRETSSGFWKKYQYDDKNNKIYEEDSDGNCKKYTYDDNDNLIYFETRTTKYSITIE